jgi:glycogen debranching enzyme
MDNATRNPYLKDGGCGTDISCEMVLFARDMAEIASINGRLEEAVRFENEAQELGATINRLMWDPDKHFYYDLTADDTRVPVKCISGFWALIAGVASKEQAAALAAELENPKTFGRRHPVPTVAADQPGYDPKGGYWRGAAWPPTTTMVIRGLEKYSQTELARTIALQDLDVTWQVFQKTGTVWENYAPDAIAPGKPAKADLVGWTGIVPILFLLEYGVGLKPDAPHNQLVWDLRSDKRVGCERYRFNGHVVDLLAIPDPGNAWNLSVKSDGAFKLVIKTGSNNQTFDIHTGGQAFRCTDTTNKGSK